MNNLLMKLSVARVLCALAILLAAESAFAGCYNLLPAKWCTAASNHIHYIPVIDYTPAQWPVGASLSAWNYASPTNYEHLYKVTTGAYVSYWSGAYGSSLGWIGQTTLTYDGNGCFIPGQAKVLLNDSTVGNNYKLATRHETGHVLGLDHVPDNCSVIMYPYAPNCNPTAPITTCDGQGAAAIYPY